MTQIENTLSYREIYDQPRAIASLLADRALYLETVQRFFSENRFDEVIFTGCGTSLYIAQIAAAVFSRYNGIKAKAVPCSELFFNTDSYIGRAGTLVCPITRKSYTTEVRMAIDRVREYPNVKTLALTCCEGSREYNDECLLFRDSHEDSVVMTKSFTGLVTMSVILAMAAAGRAEEIERLETALPSLMAQHLEEGRRIAAELVTRHGNADFFVVLGQGAHYGIANECVNKIKEMSLSKTEAFHTLEYRHGPMSLVDENTCIVLLASANTGEMERELLLEMRSCGAVVCVVGEDTGLDWSFCHYRLLTRSTLTDEQRSAATGIIGQLLGLELARAKGIDPDAPRHLAQAIVLR